MVTRGVTLKAQQEGIVGARETNSAKCGPAGSGSATKFLVLTSEGTRFWSNLGDGLANPTDDHVDEAAGRRERLGTSCGVSAPLRSRGPPQTR
jgi:hypothetical protein